MTTSVVDKSVYIEVVYEKANKHIERDWLMPPFYTISRQQLVVILKEVKTSLIYFSKFFTTKGFRKIFVEPHTGSRLNFADHVRS